MKRFKPNQTTIVYYETGRREPKIGYLMDLIKPELSDFCGD
jgi:hypothetical protein